jgi:hypothetical protein
MQRTVVGQEATFQLTMSMAASCACATAALAVACGKQQKKHLQVTAGSGTDTRVVVDRCRATGMVMSSAAIECVAVAAQLLASMSTMSRWHAERRHCSQGVSYSNRVAVVNLKVGVRRCDIGLIVADLLY